MTYQELADRIHAIEMTVEKAHEDLTALLVAVEKMEKAEKETAKPNRQLETYAAAIEQARKDGVLPEGDIKPATLEDVRAALTDLTSAKSADTTKQLLAEYGAKKLSDIPADKYATLLADAKGWAGE